ncbi:MAG: hypothetical protein J6W84_05895, partial [Bacteroidales bacterium]|nr:hypothetical protein [Bacteroidales bacterium]
MKRFLLSVTLVLGIITSTIAQGVSVWDGSSTIWTNGSGTSSDPYLIESAANLRYLVDNIASYNTNCFKQTVDIDLDFNPWSPIGNATTNFKGTYNGAGHTIEHLIIGVNGTTPIHHGLFGYLNGATVKNVKLISGSMNILTNGATFYTGGIAGYATASVIDSCENGVNITVTNTTTSTAFDTYIGGICGYMTGTASSIKNSCNKGQIQFTATSTSATTNRTFTNQIGGIAGYIQYGKIECCSNQKPINIDVTSLYYKTVTTKVGGIVGSIYATSANPVTIQTSLNNAYVAFSQNTRYTASTYSYSVTSYMYVGGITGYHETGYITTKNCYNKGDIKPGTIQTYYASSSYPYAYNYIYWAGITGYVPNNICTFSSCYSAGKVPTTPASVTGSNNTYNHDCLVYNFSSAYGTALNMFYLNTCGCNQNRTGATAAPMAQFISTVASQLGNAFAQDGPPYNNGGFPILVNYNYESRVKTYHASDTSAMSARLNGSIDISNDFPSTAVIDSAGFQYKLTGAGTWNNVHATVADTISTVIAGLSACTQYTYRAYASIDGVIAYGDTMTFRTKCQDTGRVVYTLCYGDTLTYRGNQYYPADTYYYITQDSTIAVEMHWYASRHNYIDPAITYGQTFSLNGQDYTETGEYTQTLLPDANGCDSIIHLRLYVDYQNAGADQWDCVTQNTLSYGNGTQADPYIIESAGTLSYFADAVNAGNDFAGKYFKLVRDIDWTGCTWRAIGNTSSTPFRGHFDGDGHEIQNINIVLGAAYPYGGVFGRVINGSIKNLYITGTNTLTASTSTSTYYMGGIVGYASNTKIDNCHNNMTFNVANTGTTTTFSTYLGGIAGYLTNSDTLTNCSVNGNIDYSLILSTNNTSSQTWDSYVGGIVGRLEYTSINKCYHEGTFNLTNEIGTHYKTSNLHAGGIVGYSIANSSTTILVKQTYHKGNMTVADKATSSSSSYSSYAYTYIGGIFGYQNGGYTTLSDCYNRGNIIPQLYAQGYSSSYPYGYAYVYAGGLIGYIQSVTNTRIQNSYNTGVIPSTYTNLGGSNSTKSYNHDCLGYNTSGVTQNNSYYWDQCNCTNNYNHATPQTRQELISQQMPGTLNSSPSSGIWTRDNLPYVNNGYPIFGSMTYMKPLSADSAGNITAISATLYGSIDQTSITPSVISETGIEYKVLGSSTYTQISSTTLNGSFQIPTNILQPCTTYVYRAYAIIDGNYAYSDTATFLTSCQPVKQIDTTLCYNDTLYVKGIAYHPDGNYFEMTVDTTYVINMHYYASRHHTIDTTIKYGDVFNINGQSYSTSGHYTQYILTDIHGCDSIIHINVLVDYSDAGADVWDCVKQEAWVSGSGAQGDPYLIESAAQLSYFADQVNAGNSYTGTYFRLARDIDWNGCTWRAIGNTSSTPFRGHFDGDGHEIQNIQISLTGSAYPYAGIFGNVINGSIKNLYITGNSTFTASTSSSTYYMGGIVGSANNTKIDNCHNDMTFNVANTGTTTTFTTYLGGIAGYLANSDTLTNCSVNGNINYSLILSTSNSSSQTWNSYVGGIVGRLEYTSINKCYHEGTFNLTNEIGTHYKTSNL